MLGEKVTLLHEKDSIRTQYSRLDGESKAKGGNWEEKDDSII